MLSDRHRPAKILALLLALLGLCGWYAWQAEHRAVGFARCMADPQANDGRTVELALWRVESVEPGGYHVRGVEHGVPVRGDPEGLELGATVSLVGRFDAREGVLVEQWREVHHSRRVKAALGVLGLLAAAAYAAATLRWRAGRLVLHA